MDLLRTRQVDPIHQSPQTRAYGFFAHGTVPPFSPLLIWLLLSSSPPSPAVFPDPFPSPISRSRRFRRASGTTQPSDDWPSIARHFAIAYRSAYSGATRRLGQSS